ncbi:transposase [Streptomonospora arabica]|uniref:Transposase n=1 Tax=Streptomonospora arabica TaxID=412417 RepID=A0ABV9SNJ1_9ACTN
MRIAESTAQHPIASQAAQRLRPALRRCGCGHGAGDRVLPRRRQHGRGGGDQLVLDGILFVLRSGCPWRMIPRDLLPWDATYRWYRT